MILIAICDFERSDPVRRTVSLVGACSPTDGILACPLGYQRFALQNDRERGVILSGATCPLVGIVAARRPKGFLPLSHASRRAAAGRYSLRLSMCARHCVPNAHASLREIPPCGAARRSSVPPPKNCSFLPPPAAVTVLPSPRHARTPSVGRMANGRDSSSFHSSE